MDIIKGAMAAWVAQSIRPENHIIHMLAPIAAILGHNYSIFLAERDANGRLRLRGGAGGAPALGGAAGLWWPILPIVFSLGALVFFTLGIASVTTLAVGLFVIIIFAVRAYLGLMPPVEVVYGIIAEILLMWALRPNIQKLISGNERIVKYSLNGWLRARKEHVEENKTN